MKKLILPILTLAFLLFSKPVSYKDAELVAKNWYKNYSPAKNATGAIKEYFTTDYKGSTSFYTFVFDEGGWINIAADDVATPILGYSFTSKNLKSTKGLNPAYDSWMDSYSKAIHEASEQKTYSENLLKRWENIKNNRFLEKNKNYQVGPFLTDLGDSLTWNWDQDYWFKDLCPLIGSDTTVVGCVATAMAMVMRYHEFPFHGNGSNTYSWNGSSLEEDFSQSSYYWNSMPGNTYHNPPDQNGKNAMARISYDCGISVNMNYGTGASGALTSDVPNALANYFGYSATAYYKQRSEYTDIEWKNKLQSEFNSSRPVIYRGVTGDGGHAWVCDGYRDIYKNYHMNWGWNGSGNGWFPIDSLVVGSYDFDTDHGAVFSIFPGTVEYSFVNESLNSSTYEPSATANYSVSAYEAMSYSPFKPSFGYNIKLRIENSVGGLITIVDAGQSDPNSANYQATFQVPEANGTYRILMQMYSTNLTENKLLAAGDYLYFDVAQETGAPSDLQITVNTNSVNMSWNTVQDAEKYYIYGMSDPYGTRTLLDSTTATSYTYPNVGNKYFFEVSSKNTAQPPPSGFVLIPAGTFQMGDHFSEGDTDERPLHSVTLSDFYMGATEVTQAEWSAYMPAENWSSYGTGDTYPAYYVSWYEIIKYCNLRSIAEGLTPCYTISSSTDPAVWGTVPTSTNTTWNAAICNWSANGYRLPSEAEWEYASRGGIHNADNLRYSGCNLETDLTNYAWYSANSGSTSHPVGTKLPNQLGLYDMSGNLWEWCWDWYGSYTSDSVTNPYGPTTGSPRVVRGGYWDYAAYYCRVANRSYGYPHYSYLGGFRLSRTP